MARRIFTDESLVAFVDEVKTYTKTSVDESIVTATDDDINAMLAKLNLSDVPVSYKIYETIHMSDSTDGAVYEISVADGRLAIAEQTD